MRFADVAALSREWTPALWAEALAALPRRPRGADPEGAHALARLVRAGLLRTDAHGFAWTSERARAERAAAAARSHPVSTRRVHAACGRHLAKRRDGGDLARAVEHLLAAELRPEAESLALARVEAALMVRWSPLLLEALDTLTSTEGPAPPELHALHARALERSGALGAALEAYELAEAAYGVAPSPRPRRRAAPSSPHAAADTSARLGLVAVRVGRVVRAERALSDARRAAGKALLPMVEELAARLAMARGELPAAEAAFERAARAARARRDAQAEGAAHAGLGVVAMRRGRPRIAAERYQHALECLGSGDAAGARIQANWAAALSAAGAYDEALRRFGEVIALRERLGDRAGVANSLAARAAAREGSGDLDGAWDDLARARHVAAMASDAALALEIHLLRQGLALRRGDLVTARAEARSASELRGDLEALDPLLGAMCHEAEAHLSVALGEPGRAARLARLAYRAFCKQGAAFFSTRARLLLASIALAARAPERALGHLRAAASTIARDGMRFPTAWSLGPLVSLAESAREPALEPVIDALSGPLGRSAPALRPTGLAASRAHRLVDRRGSRLVTAREVEALRAAPPPLLLDLPRQLLRVRGKEHPVGTKRVLASLLLALLERQGKPIASAALHRTTWGIERFDEAAATRLKVALCRLRKVLGHSTMVTTRGLDEAGAVVTEHGLAPTVEFALLELA